MTQTSYPFSNSPILDTAQWSKIAQNWLGTGVIKGQLNELQVYADSTGMQVKAKSGQAYLKGHFFEATAEEILAISAANSTNPRIDRVIVKLDWTANTIQLAVLQGVAAVTPVAPALTQNTSRWEISLAQVRVNAAVSTIAASNITDERTIINGVQDNPLFFSDGGTISAINPSELRQVPITSGILKFNKSFTLGTNEMIVKESGIYFVDAQVNWTGMNAGIVYETVIRRTKVDGTYNDYTFPFRGVTDWGTNDNTNGGVPSIGTVLFDCNIGDKFTFFVRHYDSGVRAVVTSRIKVFKVSTL